MGIDRAKISGTSYATSGEWYAVTEVIRMMSEGSVRNNLSLTPAQSSAFSGWCSDPRRRLNVRTVIAMLVLLTLGGCMTAQERAEEVQAKAEQVKAKIASQDDQSCQSYGAAPGTQAYITCRTQLQAARIGAPPPVNVSVAPAPAAPTIQQPMTTSCMRTGNMTTCNSM
jgi:hypothetical protein